MSQICEVHDKEMKQNSKGWYCATPTKRTPDGKTVLEWCTWKPSKEATPERQELEGRVLASMNLKLDKIMETLEFLKVNAGLPPAYQTIDKPR